MVEVFYEKYVWLNLHLDNTFTSANPNTNTSIVKY